MFELEIGVFEDRFPAQGLLFEVSSGARAVVLTTMSFCSDASGINDFQIFTKAGTYRNDEALIPSEWSLLYHGALVTDASTKKAYIPESDFRQVGIAPNRSRLFYAVFPSPNAQDSLVCNDALYGDIKEDNFVISTGTSTSSYFGTTDKRLNFCGDLTYFFRREKRDIPVDYGRRQRTPQTQFDPLL